MESGGIRYIMVDYLPQRIAAYLTECTEPDGEYYTMVINRNCGDNKIAESISHELEHYFNDDFHSPLSVAEIELLRHK